MEADSSQMAKGMQKQTFDVWLNAATVLFYQRFAHIIILCRACVWAVGCGLQPMLVRPSYSKWPSWQNIIIWNMHI